MNKEICPLCEAVHDSVNCDDRDMTVIGLCNLCLGVARKCYAHKVNEKMQHLLCIEWKLKPHSDEEYAAEWEKILANKAEYDKLAPIPAHVVAPEDFDKKRRN